MKNLNEEFKDIYKMEIIEFKKYTHISLSKKFYLKHPLNKKKLHIIIDENIILLIS